MARDVESLVLRMSADLRSFEKQMGKMRETADKRLSEVERRAMQSDKRLARVSRDMGTNMVANFRDGLKGMAPVLASAFSAAAVIRYADSYTELQNRLKAAGLEGERLVRVEGQLYEAANRNGVAIDAVAQLFQRASLSRDALGASDEQLIALTNGVTAALRVQGVSAQAASGPLLQLGQALGAGTVRAEELNSLLEGTPVILQAAAAGSDRFKGNMNALTKAVRDGTVSSQELFAALLRGLPELEKKAAELPPTVAQAFETLNNELGRFVGQTDKGLSATERMAQAIVLLANNLDVLVTAAGVAVTMVGTRMVVAYGAAAASGLRYQATLLSMAAAQTGVSRTALLASASLSTLRTAALFFVTNPIGIAITAIAAALALVAIRGDESAVAVSDMTRATDAARDAFTRYETAAKTAAEATGENARQANINAEEMRKEAQAALESARALAVRARAMAGAAATEAEAMRNSPEGGRGQAALYERRARDAQVRARQAEIQAMLLEGDLYSIEERIKASRSGGGGGGVATATGGGGGRDTEAAREMLELERDIIAARATGDQAAIDAAEERLLLAQTIQKYERAGYADAESRALEEIGWLNQIEALEERRTAIAKLMGEYREADVRRAEEAAERAREQNDILLDQLDLEAELARLRGDDAALANAERRYFIERETNRILSQRKDITEEQARAEATGRYDQLRAADIIGGLGRDDPAAQAAALYEEVERLRQADLLSEEEAAQRRAQINAEYNEARLTDTRSMLDALAGLQNSSNKKLAAIGKAAAITQATIDGYLAVQKALASAPPPFNFVQAAIVGAAAAANVASIAGMKDGGIVSGPGGPRDDKVPVMLSNGEFVVNAASAKRHRALLESVNRGGLPAMADGGIVGRVASLSTITARPSGGSSLAYSPTIDARGADLGVVRRLERLMEEQSAQLEGRVTNIVARAEKYKLGTGRGGRRR